MPSDPGWVVCISIGQTAEESLWRDTIDVGRFIGVTPVLGERCVPGAPTTNSFGDEANKDDEKDDAKCGTEGDEDRDAVGMPTSCQTMLVEERSDIGRRTKSKIKYLDLSTG